MRTESMIERVARALDPVAWDFGAGRVDALKQARAAIEAMREPTDGMVEAGNRMGCIPTYSRMIDAALSEEGE